MAFFGDRFRTEIITSGTLIDLGPGVSLEMEQAKRYFEHDHDG